MRFCSGVLAVALALCSSSTSLGFTSKGLQPRQRIQNGVQPLAFGLVNGRSNVAGFGRVQTQRRLADGDDEEDYDEPLAKGVDSVSWLPSVAGGGSVVAAGSEAGEVSGF